MNSTQDRGGDAARLTQTSAPVDRLPCRGCRADCANYAVCEGRPWRMPPAAVTRGR